MYNIPCIQHSNSLSIQFIRVGDQLFMYSFRVSF